MANKKEKKQGRILIIFGIILIIISSTFLLYNKKRIENKKEEAIALEEMLKKEAHAQNRNERVEDHRKEYYDKIQESDLGVLRIDKIKVVIPVRMDASKKSLTQGAGLVKNTDLPTSKVNTTTVLAGHRGGKNESLSFINIDKLKEGDEIKLTTREEELYYKVIGQEVIEPNDWSKFAREDGKTKLILMACHPYPKNDKRILIKAELVKNSN